MLFYVYYLMLLPLDAKADAKLQLFSGLTTIFTL